MPYCEPVKLPVPPRAPSSLPSIHCLAAFFTDSIVATSTFPCYLAFSGALVQTRDIKECGGCLCFSLTFIKWSILKSEACLFGLSTVKYIYLNFQLDVLEEVKERNKTKQNNLNLFLGKVLSILDD